MRPLSCYFVCVASVDNSPRENGSACSFLCRRFHRGTLIVFLLIPITHGDQLTLNWHTRVHFIGLFICRVLFWLVFFPNKFQLGRQMRQHKKTKQSTHQRLVETLSTFWSSGSGHCVTNLDLLHYCCLLSFAVNSWTNVCALVTLS